MERCTGILMVVAALTPPPDEKLARRLVGRRMSGAHSDKAVLKALKAG
jgi:hypothetical protein